MKVRFDAVAMYATIGEMERRLRGGKIRRIQQLASHLYLFTVFRPRGLHPEDSPPLGWGTRPLSAGSFEGPEVRFIVSLAAGSARIHLAERAYGTAETPTSFCMLLRKHVEGARIASVRTEGLERVALLDFMVRGQEQATGAELEAGALVAHLLPTGRTLVLLDRTRRVMGEMRHKMRKGTPWELASPAMPHATDLSGAEVVRALEALQEPLPVERALTRVCFGIGTVHGREIAVRAGLSPREPFEPPAGAALAAAWDAFWERIREGRLEPTAVALSDEQQLLLPFPFESQAGRPSRSYSSMSRMVEDAFADAVGQAGLEELRTSLLDGLRRQRERAMRRVAAQEDDLRRAGQADTWKLYGDLLTANIHRIPARARSIAVEDYTRDDAPEVEIALDPDLSPQENARACYDRYKKAKRGLDAIAEAIERSRQDVEYLDSLHASVETARERDDLREIEAQMQAQRMLPGGMAKKRPKGPAARPRRFHLDGWDILVGRNPQQNELLTMKQARPEDWWLHARQIPGAHVVLRGPGGPGAPPDEVLLAGARLAAGFSRAAGDTRVPVDWTRVRYVKKPPGTPAGYVTYSREQTLLVEPATDLGGT